MVSKLCSLVEQKGSKQKLLFRPTMLAVKATGLKFPSQFGRRCACSAELDSGIVKLRLPERKLVRMVRAACMTLTFGVARLVGLLACWPPPHLLLKRLSALMRVSLLPDWQRRYITKCFSCSRSLRSRNPRRISPGTQYDYGTLITLLVQ
jgi:hypothetical protein